MTSSNRYRAFMATQTVDYTDLATLEKHAKATSARFAIILHDLDQGTDHYHIALEYQHPKTINAVAKQLNIPPNFIEKWDKRTYNMWSYLIHDTTDSKNTKANYQHYIENVDKFSTNIENFAEFATPPLPSGVSKRQLDDTINKILTGQLTRKELLQPDKITYYYQNLRKIDQAIKLRTESLRYNPPDNTTTYIYGKTGQGKTTHAITLASQLYPNSYTVASSANDPLQDYTGEKCLVIDDFRPQDYDFMVLLAMLDPYHRQKTHKSRYYNKPLATELIIITSIHSLDDTLDYYHMALPSEDMTQLKRRIQTINYLEDGNIHPYIYNEQTDEYLSP